MPRNQSEPVVVEDKLDTDTAAVISTLLLNLIVAGSIVLGWFIIRRFRGDKQNVHRHMSEISDVTFDQNFRANAAAALQSQRLVSNNILSFRSPAPNRELFAGSVPKPISAEFHSSALPRESSLVNSNEGFGAGGNQPDLVRNVTIVSKAEKEGDNREKVMDSLRPP
jgi:hypothetical protein